MFRPSQSWSIACITSVLLATSACQDHSKEVEREYVECTSHLFKERIEGVIDHIGDFDGRHRASRYVTIQLLDCDSLQLPGRCHELFEYDKARCRLRLLVSQMVIKHSQVEFEVGSRVIKPAQTDTVVLYDAKESFKIRWQLFDVVSSEREPG